MAATKYNNVRQELMQAIRAGEFDSSGRLPTERDLALRFGVSFMTARRAVTELVEANLLERRHGSGTYIRGYSAERLSTRTVNLVCDARENSLSGGFLRLGADVVERRGWRRHIIRLHPGDDHAAVRALERGEHALVLSGEHGPSAAMVTAMQRAIGRVVFVGSRQDHNGIPSVLADDVFAVRLAIAQLTLYGHRHIAMLCPHPGGPVSSVQANAWKDSMRPDISEDLLEKWLLSSTFDVEEDVYELGFNLVSDGFATKRLEDVTAIIAVGDELAVGALKACRDAGRSIPESISLITTSDSPLLRYSNPAVTAIDVDIRTHLNQAITLIDAFDSGDWPPKHGLVRLVAPSLITRESVGTAFDR